MGRSSPALLLALAVGCSSAVPRETLRIIDGRAQPTPPANPGAYEHYLRAELALARDQPARASEQLRSAVALDPASPYLHTRLAAVLLRTQQRRAARAELQRALALDPRFPDALRLQAELQRQEHRGHAAKSSHGGMAHPRAPPGAGLRPNSRAREARR